MGMSDFVTRKVEENIPAGTDALAQNIYELMKGNARHLHATVTENFPGRSTVTGEIDGKKMPDRMVEESFRFDISSASWWQGDFRMSSGNGVTQGHISIEDFAFKHARVEGETRQDKLRAQAQCDIRAGVETKCSLDITAPENLKLSTTTHPDASSGSEAKRTVTIIRTESGREIELHATLIKGAVKQLVIDADVK